MASRLAVELTDDLELDPLVMNGSGIISYPGLFVPVQNRFGAFVLKSTGRHPRDGNETPIYHRTPHYSVNAVGLPNPGCEAMAEELAHYRDRIDKPICASVFGTNVKEFVETVEALDPYVDFFELNLSCPNIKPGEKAGIEIGTDPILTRTYVVAARRVTDKPIFAKLSPTLYIMDPRAEKELNIVSIAEVCLENGANGISAVNTIPGALEIDVYAERPVLSAGLGGLGGPGIRPIGVGATARLRKNLGDKVPLIGMGGVESGRDVIAYIEAGATAVAMGTTLDGGVRKIEKTMERVYREMDEILYHKGKGPDELRGVALPFLL